MAALNDRYELQQMSGGLPAAKVANLQNDDQSAVSHENTVLQDNSFQQSRNPSETSPEARGSTHHVELGSPKSSLETLERACRVNVRSNTANHDNDDPLRGSLSGISNEEASGIPLPCTYFDNASSSHPSLMISSPLSSLEPSDAIEVEQPNLLSESCIAYKKNNIRLSKHFPHLQSVCSDSRRDEANITIFDYSGNILRNVQHRSIDFMSENGQKLNECRQFICSIDASFQVETRLIVVEDLGQSLINLLGATFALSPEFFEEHLHQSEYRGYCVTEASPSTWKTSNLRKDYVSFTWSRPGEDWYFLGPEQWEDLLNHDPARVETVSQFNNRSGRSSNVFHSFVAKTNICRWPSDLSTDPAGRVPDKVPCGWKERATVCNRVFDGLQYVILLLDPTPLVEKATTGIADAMGPVISQGRHGRYGSSNCKSRSKYINVSEHQEDWNRQTEILSSFTQTHCRTPWTLAYHDLFGQTPTDPAAQEIFDQLSPFQSTVEAFKEWLSSASAKEVEGYKNRLGPGSMIFRIAHQDTMGLLQLMRSAVTDIDLASSDVELQETALQWRCRLDEFRALMIDLEASLHSFMNFLRADEPTPSKECAPKLDTDPMEYLFHDAISAIELHKQRITQVYSSLTSKTQISDSHRSIAEAETVTRLTELAFLFIPLSFSTSIFGMQFVSGSTSATTYIAVALALTSGAYLLRFIIQRTREQRYNLGRSISDRITAYANLRAGSRIPTTTFGRWLVHVVKRYILRFWKLSFLGATILIMLIIPLPIIWTSSLIRGLQIALSCVLISIPIFFVCSYYGAKYLKRQKLAQASDSSYA